MLAAMVLLAAAFSLRFFRFGGVQKMVLGGIGRRLSALRHGEGHRRLEQGRTAAADGCGGLPAVVGGLTGLSRCCTRRTGDGAAAPLRPDRRVARLVRRVASSCCARATMLSAGRPTCATCAGPDADVPAAAEAAAAPAQRASGQEQMLVRAEEINYDYTNKRVSAVGNVQIYYAGSTLEADRVIYDQKTKRLHAEGNVRLTQPDGTVTYGEIMDLSDDFRDGFVDSLRLDTTRADPHGRGARRAVERQLHGLPERRLHRLRGLQGRSHEAAELAGQGGADHPRSGREDDLFRERASSNSSACRSPICRTSRRPIRR